MEGDQQGNTASSGVLDALLTSINTEGLTASSLQQSLAAMDVRRDEVLRALLERTQAACATPADAAGALAAEAACAEALASLADRGLAEGSEALASAAALAAQDASLVAELQATQAAAAEAGALAGLQQRLAEYDALVAQGAFAHAAALIRALEGADGDAAAAVAERRRLFQEYVATAPPQYFAVDPGTYMLALVPPAASTGPALQQLWAAAATLGALPAALGSLGESAIERCVKPLLAAEAAAAGPGGVMESPAGSVASSALSAATAAVGRAARAGTERALYRIMKALCDNALGGSPELAARLGEAFWPPAAAAYIGARLAPLKPIADADLVGFMRAGSLAVKLEQKAVKLGLWSAQKEGPVAKYVRVTVGRVLASKRVGYATAARDLLTSDAAREATTVTAAAAATRPGAARALFGSGGGGGSGAAAAELAGEPSLGDVGPYAVSRAAEGLAALMHEALGEACRSGSAALAQAMCGAVLDLASLLVALGDSNAADLEVPYVAALRYNDCMHVYRTLCALPAAHAPRLQALVHPAVNFVGPAQRVREAGEGALAGCVARQSEELAAAAVELRRWQGLDGPGVIRCNKAARQLLSAFSRLGGALFGVLPRVKFVETVAALADALAGALSDAILAMSDISADESEEIPKILAVLTASESGMLAAAAAAAGPDVAALAAELTAAALHVARLREVAELLDVPSREIALRWRSGRLAAAGLAREQVVDLVRALFEDNEYSRASLNAILSS